MRLTFGRSAACQTTMAPSSRISQIAAAALQARRRRQAKPPLDEDAAALFRALRGGLFPADARGFPGDLLCGSGERDALAPFCRDADLRPGGRDDAAMGTF